MEMRGIEGNQEEEGVASQFSFHLTLIRIQYHQSRPTRHQMERAGRVSAIRRISRGEVATKETELTKEIDTIGPGLPSHQSALKILCGRTNFIPAEYKCLSQRREEKPLCVLRVLCAKSFQFLPGIFLFSTAELTYLPAT